MSPLRAVLTWMVWLGKGVIKKISFNESESEEFFKFLNLEAHTGKGLMMES